MCDVKEIMAIEKSCHVKKQELLMVNWLIRICIRKLRFVT
jgi:hypothetical protein